MLRMRLTPLPQSELTPVSDRSYSALRKEQPESTTLSAAHSRPSEPCRQPPVLIADDDPIIVEYLELAAAISALQWKRPMMESTRCSRSIN
jgi:hypothetical protein